MVTSVEDHENVFSNLGSYFNGFARSKNNYQNKVAAADAYSSENIKALAKSEYSAYLDQGISSMQSILDTHSSKLTEGQIAETQAKIAEFQVEYDNLQV